MGVYRRPHDYRQQFVAVAALFAVAEADAVPASQAQSRFWSAYSIPFRPVQRATLAPIFLAEVALVPETPRLPAQERFWAGHRFKAFHPHLTANKLPAAILAPEEEYAFFQDAQESWWVKNDPPPAVRQRLPQYDLPALLFEPQAAESPPIPRFASQEGFWIARRIYSPLPQFLALPAALFPVVVPDDPFFQRLTAQESFWSMVRPGFRPAGGGALSVPLFPLEAAPDSPPISRFVEAFRRSYLHPLPGRILGAALFPPVVVDDPALACSPAHEAFWRAYRTPWPYPRGGASLAAMFIESPAGGGSECCEETLLRLDAIDTALASLATAVSSLATSVTNVQATVSSNQTLINALGVDITTIMGALSGTITIQTGQSKELLELIARIEQRLRLLTAAAEKRGIKT